MTALETTTFTLEECLSQAAEAFDRNNLKAARKALEQALDLDPGNGRVALSLGHVAMGLGEGRDALKFYRQALDLRPDCPEGLASFALALKLIGRPNEAERRSRQALALDPNQSLALKVLSRICLDTGRHEEARAACRKLLDLHPRDPEGLQLLSQCSFDLEPFEVESPWGLNVAEPALRPAPSPLPQAGHAASPGPARLDPVLDQARLLEYARQVGDAWKEAPYYDEFEAKTDQHWKDLIWPFIQNCDFSSVLDLAAGHGRNSQRFKELARRIWIVDINQENIDHCRKRFAGDDRFHYLKNNGVSLAGVPDASVSLVFTFDSMVHFDTDVVRAYLAEFYRVLAPGGFGFCHHSNFSGNPCGSVYHNAGWRNYMSKSLFAHYCAKEGLTIVKSQIIDWGGRPDSDCLTLFRKESSPPLIFVSRSPVASSNSNGLSDPVPPSPAPQAPAVSPSAASEPSEPVPGRVKFADEIQFWDRELTLQGTFAKDMTNRAKNPEAVFPPDLLPLIEDLRERYGCLPRVLDAGSGPLSYLAHGHQQKRIELTAADPLADVYLDLLAKHGIQPTSPLVPCYGEELAAAFGENAFHLVYMKNALDHAQDPARVLAQLVEVLCPGGYLWVQGGVRESSRNQGAGLHRHDLYLGPDGRLQCESLDARDHRLPPVCLQDGLPLEVVKSSKPTDVTGQWLSVIWKKLNGSSSS
jgi:ubiquinone/menaquinone biosynthesis C-methylase UbiE